MKSKQEKHIAKRITPTCVICGKKMYVICYRDHTYRGGHYFGKIPLYRKSEWKKSAVAGTREVKMLGIIMTVFKKEPKPYDHAEYWECPRCYWGK